MNTWDVPSRVLGHLVCYELGLPDGHHTVQGLAAAAEQDPQQIAEALNQLVSGGDIHALLTPSRPPRFRRVLPQGYEGWLYQRGEDLLTDFAPIRDRLLRMVGTTRAYAMSVPPSRQTFQLGDGVQKSSDDLQLYLRLMRGLGLIHLSPESGRPRIRSYWRT